MEEGEEEEEEEEEEILGFFFLLSPSNSSFSLQRLPDSVIMSSVDDDSNKSFL
jgi:hypothetical protein